MGAIQSPGKAGDAMIRHLGQITFLVTRYDEAIAFFTDNLHFVLCKDTQLSMEKPWVVPRLMAGPLYYGPGPGENNRPEAAGRRTPYRSSQEGVL